MCKNETVSFFAEFINITSLIARYKAIVPKSRVFKPCIVCKEVVL
jgi:hypothetical protein